MSLKSFLIIHTAVNIFGGFFGIRAPLKRGPSSSRLLPARTERFWHNFALINIIVFSPLLQVHLGSSSLPWRLIDLLSKRQPLSIAFLRNYLAPPWVNPATFRTAASSIWRVHGTCWPFYKFAKRQGLVRVYLWSRQTVMKGPFVTWSTLAAEENNILLADKNKSFYSTHIYKQELLHFKFIA